MKTLEGTRGEQRWSKSEPRFVFITSYKDKSRGRRGRARGPGSLRGDRQGPAHDQAGRITPTAKAGYSKRPEQTTWLQSQTVQIQTPAPQVLAVETLDEALNLPRFLICKMEMAVALRPMPDVSVKWVKTYKSPRTVSGTE